MSGYYGPVADIGLLKCTAIISQLSIIGYLLILLDELVQKGYGLGSGVSLFMCTNVCRSILWDAASPLPITKSQEDKEYEGSIVAFLHHLIFKDNKLTGVFGTFTRSNAPNLWNLFAAAVIFLIVIYFQGFRVEL